jgi:hypothetical protein
MLHLSWVLTSFVVPYVPTLYITITFFLPVYLVEFVMIYTLGMPIIRKSAYVTAYGGLFKTDFVHPVFEQLLYFVNLVLLFMCIGCLKLAIQYD